MVNVSFPYYTYPEFQNIIIELLLIILLIIKTKIGTYKNLEKELKTILKILKAAICLCHIYFF